LGEGDVSNNAYPDALPADYRLHWYVIERVLGQGGFGITYLARDTNLDQPVAIKEYLPVEVATRLPGPAVRSRTGEHGERFRLGLERFLREARTLARFDHPNIVRVSSVFESNNTAYMVMRFEEGDTLAALLGRRQALPEPELMRLLLPILDGLELVHNAGFIHRDIKPDNIHVRSDGSPVLLDFGSARYAVGQSRTLTILVAPGYAPFEQYYSNGENQGPWTDIYGLGATCYRAIAGRPPLDAIARSKGVLGSTKEVLLPAVVIGAGRYSERLLKAVDHALAFPEQERPQSISEWRQELVGQAAAPGAAPRPAPAAAAPDTTALLLSGRTTHSAWSRARGPVVWAAAGAAAIMAALAVMPWLARPGPVAIPDAARAPEAALPTAAVADSGESDGLRSRLAALEKLAEDQQKLSEERKRLSEALQRAESDRQRLEEERLRSIEKAKDRARQATAAAEAARPEPRPRPATQRPSPPAASEPAPPAALPPVRAEPVSVPVAPPSPPPAPVIAPAPQPVAAPSPAELVANADRAYARGSYIESAAVLKPLAERGNSKAQVRLGDLYLQGEGVERNDQEAVRLFRKAADQGDNDAQLRLGDMYAKGRGVPQNNFHAYVWYSVAARAGNPTAKIHQERFAAMLQAVEVQQAGKLVDRLALPKER
jgi:serine/threonine protein kinase/TPR repeat protein